MTTTALYQQVESIALSSIPYLIGLAFLLSVTIPLRWLRHISVNPDRKPGEKPLRYKAYGPITHTSHETESDKLSKRMGLHK